MSKVVVTVAVATAKAVARVTGGTLHRIGALLLLTAVVELAACGGSPVSKLGPDGGMVVGGNNPGVGGKDDLAAPAISVEGGAAESPGGQGQPGGTIHIVTNGALTADPALQPAATPDLPAASGQAASLGADALNSDVSMSGSVKIAGDVKGGGTDAIRHITVKGGDIYVTGSLRTADLGGARQAISLSAPDGTVFVSGTIDASGAGSGQAGGATSIDANRIVVTGRIATAGGDGAATGGAAGRVALSATDSMTLTGTIDSFGGGAHQATTAMGGAGGDIALAAGGDVTLQATMRLRGGAANGTGPSAQGGAGAMLAVDTKGAVHVGGTVDARGGSATASGTGGTVAGGAAGTLKIGETAPPSGVDLLVPLLTTGGTGAAGAGAGGTFALESAGDINLRGRVACNGGAIAPGAGGDGASGGTVKIEATSETAALTVAATGEVDLDGGQSGATGRAGGGGQLSFITRDGNMSMAGKLYARGGTARDPSGGGGDGGNIYLFSDNNHNGFGGNLTIEVGGLIDASGGAGSQGGSARNNGTDTPDVASFPDHQDQIAVLLNTDGMHGETRDGALQNLGSIVARGGASNGSGGDVAFHGRALDRNPQPLRGDVQTDADGSGKSGQFRSE